MTNELSTAFGLGGYAPSLSMLCLHQVRETRADSSILMKTVGTRTLAVSAIAFAALEVCGHLFIGSAATAVQMSKKFTCMILIGGFVGLWAGIGWLSSQLLNRTPLKWLQFIGLQMILGWSHPKRSFDQWRLWTDVFLKLGDFANRMASLAYTIDDSINRISSWDHINYHSTKAAKLTRFGISNVLMPHVLLDPQKVANDYDCVEPWAKPLYVHTWNWMKRHPLVTAAAIATAGGVVYHYTQPGAEMRQQWVVETAIDNWLRTKGYVSATGNMMQYSWDFTAGRVWTWITNVPNRHLQNTVNKEILKFLAQQNTDFKAKDLESVMERLANLEARQ